ncbi:MAG: FAD-linked oxidase C-terminal domain-containing protein [Candidatus Zixiibacteriota bacterium]
MATRTTSVDFEPLRNRLSSPTLLQTDLTGLDKYLKDATEYAGQPTAVLFAENTDDVVEAVRFCRGQHIAIVPRGAGTGLSGGCVPSSNALVLSTERIRHLEIREVESVAHCGPGLITKELQDAVAKVGLAYPPDPASLAESTIGGNVAENAGGLRCKRFGVTKDYVVGLAAVLADGSVLKTGAFGQRGGFGVGDLLIASEGTLGIITDIAVRLVPLTSRGTTILAAFDSPADAGRTVAEITASGLILNVLEFLDGDAVDCSNEYEKTEGLERVGALLLIETTDEDREKQTCVIRQICEKNRCSSLRLEPDVDKAEALWKVRRNLSKAVRDKAKAYISEDVAVPNTRFAELVSFVAEMRRTSRIRVNSFGHAGDGNLHVYFVSNSGSVAEQQEIKAGVTRLMHKTLELGGTLTGEHGIGLAKREYLALEFDHPTLDLMHRVKAVFDPERILNPDKIFPTHEK